VTAPAPYDPRLLLPLLAVMVLPSLVMGARHLWKLMHKTNNRR
jgi:hypothetical protein